jgi:hypothetical protein
MESRKIISVGLLIIIIIISLLFSIMIKPVSKEGLYIVQNPNDSELQNITNILNDSTIDNFTKIKKIYDILKNNKISASIYNDIGTNCLNSIVEYIKIAPIKDRDGKNIDENAISKKNSEYINGIMGNKSTPPEKVFAIRNYICNSPNKCDKKLSSIYNYYETIWIEALKNYVAQLNSENGKKNKADAISYGKIN